MTVSEDDARRAIRTLVEFLGDDPDREGLAETPARVVRALREHYKGYREDPASHLKTVFSETDSYQDIISLERIPFLSHCEHHMAPFEGFVSIAYIPTDKVVGLSKLARLVDGYAKRLQIQERLTMQIGHALENSLAPQGVAVYIQAKHSCMQHRGIKKAGGWLGTRYFSGDFKADPNLRREFIHSATQ